MTQNYLQITSAIDNAIDFSKNNLMGCIDVIGNIPDYMIDDSAFPSSTDWRFWVPIKANITPEEFSEYESLVGFELPESYVMFLGYKHFIDLNFGHDIIFFKHTKNWIRDNLEAAKWYGYEYTLERGLIPFANYSDWGIVCFDKNVRYDDGEYKIVYLDHEDPASVSEFNHFRYDFLNVIKDVNSTLEQWKREKLDGG